MNNNRVFVLGGDGFCGWPASLRLSAVGYDVTIIDNFSRRDIDDDLGCESLTPISSMAERVKAWREVTGRKLYFKRVDIARNYHGLYAVLNKLQPGTIVHFAEQRAAPYSMRSPECRRYTVNNNIQGTHNLLCALTEIGLDAHVVHLGTMGVYGYGTAGLTIPEGYVKCRLVDVAKQDMVDAEIYYPPDPGSVYHMTKVMDTNLFYYYNKNEQLRITDLHQGIVWGIQTPETEKHPTLINRFDYDGDYGTVLNRFLVQAAIGHPLTVYGTGGQTRAFIHVRDMAECILLAVKNPPKQGARVQVWNQTTEQLNLMDLAQRVAEITGAEIRLYRNPRKEAQENTLVACMDTIHGLGLEPLRLNDGALDRTYGLARKFVERARPECVVTTSMWQRNDIPDKKGAKVDA